MKKRHQDQASKKNQEIEKVNLPSELEAAIAEEPVKQEESAPVSDFIDDEANDNDYGETPSIEEVVEAALVEAEAVEEAPAAEAPVEEAVQEALQEEPAEVAAAVEAPVEREFIDDEANDDDYGEAPASEEAAEASEEESEDSEEKEEALSEEEQEKEAEDQAKEKSSWYMLFDTIRFIAVGLMVGILLVVFVIQRNDVYGTSMEPTLHSGDAVFVQMLTVYTGGFKRGDIVTIDAKGMEGYTHEENLIKRIIGLPGETIKIEDGNVYINGQLLDESAYLAPGTKTYVGAEGQAKGYMEVTLGPDEYYCMGDNRGGSNDSRRMGPFKKSQLEAKVMMRVYPFNKMKFF